MTPDALFFFEKSPFCLPVYETFEETILSLFPDASIRVQKTQITFDDPRPFVCVSLTRRKIRDPADAHLVVTLGLPYQSDSPRIWQSVEPYPNRWTHHILLRPGELDDELISLISEAHAFSRFRKR